MINKNKFNYFKSAIKEEEKGEKTCLDLVAHKNNEIRLGQETNNSIIKLFKVNC